MFMNSTKYHERLTPCVKGEAFLCNRPGPGVHARSRLKVSLSNRAFTNAAVPGAICSN